MIRRLASWASHPLLLIAIAAAPIAISVALAIVHRDWPTGDRSIMGLFTHDVFSDHPPLLGTVSTLGNYTAGGGGEAVHHLGPAQFYALALPDQLVGGHPAGMLLGALAINVGAIALVVVGTRRRLRDAGAAVVVALVVTLAYGLGATLLRDIWTPHLGLWPVLALAVLTWCLVDGDTWALPWATAVASFLAQIELLFVGPALVLAVVGAGGLLWCRRSRRDEPDRPRILVPAQISGVVAVVMWLPVVIQELSGRPGNLTLLLRSLGDQDARAPGSFVWGNAVALLQVPPLFVRRASSPLQVGASPGVAAVFSAAVVVAVLVGLTVRSFRDDRTRRVVGSMLVVSWALVVGGVLNLVITPADGAVGLQYRRWMWPAAAFIWFSIGVAAAHPIRDLADAYRERGAARPAWRPAISAIALVIALIGVIPATTNQRSPAVESRAARRSIETLWSTLPESLPAQPTYVELAGADAAIAIGPEVIRRLDVEGWTVRVPPYFASSFGAHRVLSRARPAAQGLSIVSDEGTLRPGSDPVAVVGAGRPDGSSPKAFLARIPALLDHARQAPFVPTAEGARALARAIERSHASGPAQDALLDVPTRAMFDERVLRVQVAGGMASSPLSDAEARWLLAQLERTQVIAYLLPAPTPPRS
jgi:hypothetical protein